MELSGIVSIGSALAVLVAIGVLIFKTGAWKGSLDTRLSSIENSILDIKNLIYQYLSPASRRPVTAKSPLRLTDLGKEIAEQIEADEWASDLAVNLKPRTIGKSDYEIQELAIAYAQALDLTDEQRPLVYEAAFSSGLDHSQVLRVLGVVLRDKLLST